MQDPTACPAADSSDPCSQLVPCLLKPSVTASQPPNGGTLAMVRMQVGVNTIGGKSCCQYAASPTHLAGCNFRPLVGNGGSCSKASIRQQAFCLPCTGETSGTVLEGLWQRESCVDRQESLGDSTLLGHDASASQPVVHNGGSHCASKRSKKEGVHVGNGACN